MLGEKRQNTKGFGYFHHGNALSNECLLFEIEVKIVFKKDIYNFRLLTSSIEAI